MVRTIIQIGDKRLYERSAELPVEEITSKQNQQLVQDLLDTCNKHGDDTAGLSAVQIGEMKRVFVARRLDRAEEGWEVVINPTIKIIDSKPSIQWEGCMSIGTGEDRLFGPVERPRQVELSYLDKEGKQQVLMASDYMSHIIQHEMDHLDGKLFLQYISDPENVWKSIDLDKYVRSHGEYPPVH